MNPSLRQYLLTALWASTTGERDTPMDRDYSPDDFAPDAIAKAQSDLDRFRTLAGDLLNGIPDDDWAHDLWLTRNGHGTGFWDKTHRYPGSVGQDLSKIAESIGCSDCYVGDDGKVYFS